MATQELIKTTIDPKPDNAVSTPSQTNINAVMEPSQMIARALETGAGVEVIERLMGLQDRWEANNARKSFEAAMAKACGKLPAIIKNREVNFGTTHYRHEDLSGVSRQIQPILSEFGLSFRWSTETKENDKISVTCIISHEEGHHESVTLSGKADPSGGKNSIQAIGSSVTYLQRYTLKAALGLAASADDDGRGGPDKPKEKINKEQQKTLSELIYQCEGTPETFCRHYKIATIPDLNACMFDHALKALEKKKSQNMEHHNV